MVSSQHAELSNHQRIEFILCQLATADPVLGPPRLHALSENPIDRSHTVSATTDNAVSHPTPSMRLEDLQPNGAIRGILPDALVTVVNVAWFGADAIELTYKTAEGKPANELCTPVSTIWATLGL